MGLARVQCVSGCACANSLVDGLWRQRVSLVQLLSIEVSQHPRCRLRVTVVPRSAGTPGGAAPKGSGFKFQLSAAMVAHAPVVMDTYERQAADLGQLVGQRRRR